MEKTCGNCYHADPYMLACDVCEKSRKFSVHYDEEGCQHWIEDTDTLEQRYAQLEQVVREMFGELTTEWLSLDDIRRYRDQLEALGVVCDD